MTTLFTILIAVCLLALALLALALLALLGHAMRRMNWPSEPPECGVTGEE